MDSHGLGIALALEAHAAGAGLACDDARAAARHRHSRLSMRSGTRAPVSFAAMAGVARSACSARVGCTPACRSARFRRPEQPGAREAISVTMASNAASVSSERFMTRATLTSSRRRGRGPEIAPIWVVVCGGGHLHPHARCVCDGTGGARGIIATQSWKHGGGKCWWWRMIAVSFARSRGCFVLTGVCCWRRRWRRRSSSSSRTS